jgi:ABC-2 type transport system permease protein
MMAIADRIGIDALNTALAELIAQFKFSTTIQATTLDLLAAIKKHADESHHAFIDQQFTQITLYDIRLEDAQIAAAEQGFEVTLNIETAQFSASGEGEETPQEFSDYVDVVLFAQDPDDFAQDNEIIYRQKHLLAQGSNELTISVATEPKYAAVDPFVRFIDRESRDNIRALKN